MGVVRQTVSAADLPAEAFQRAKLRVLRGKHGTDKVYCLPALKHPADGVVVLFVGDQLEAQHMPEHLLALQDPKRQAVLMADKWPTCNVAVIMPSRVEGCFACFDHFLGRTTASGEPLGFAAGDLKAVTQLSSLLIDGNFWNQIAPVAPMPDSAADDSVGPAVAAEAPLPPSPATPEAASESSARAPTDCSQLDTLQDVPSSSRQPAAVSAAAEAGSGSCSTSGRAARLPVRLAGFSKGGVVLNQFLAELAASAESASQRSRDSCHVTPAHVTPAGHSAGRGSASSRLHPIDAVGRSFHASAGSESRLEQAASRSSAAVSARSIVEGSTAVPPNGGVGSRGAMYPPVSNAAPEAANPQPSAAALLCAVTELHYLDVGLNCRGAYVTDPNVAEGLKLLASADRGAGSALPATPPKVFLHGTPRQWNDPTRPWLRREAEICEKLLQAAGVDVTVRKYFADDKPSLAMHFDVLHAFQPLARVET